MKTGRVIFFLGIAIILSACQNAGREVNSTGALTQTQIAVKSSNTQTPDTLFGEIKPTNFVPEARTQKTRIPQTPTPFPFDGPPPTATVPPLLGNPKTYTAIFPSTESLIALQSTAYHYPEGASDIIQVNPIHFQELVDFLFATYYPEGYPDPQVVFFLDRYTFPRTSITYANAVWDYIKTEKIDLDPNQIIETPYFTAELSPIELDPSNPAEWLLYYEITIDYVFEGGWIALKETPEGELERLVSPMAIQINTINYPYTDTHLEDFTGDGITDFLIIRPNIMLGSNGRVYEYLTFYEGKRDGYHLVSDLTYFYYVLSSDEVFSYQINHDEVYPKLDIVLRKFPNNDINWDCNWIQHISLQWPAGREKILIFGDRIPDDPGCLIAEVSTYNNRYKIIESIKLLEKAVDLMRKSPPVHPDLEVLARYKLAVAYAASDRHELAKGQLEAIIAMETDPNAEAAQFFAPYFRDMLQQKYVPATTLCDLTASTIEGGEPISGYWKSYIYLPAGLVDFYTICDPRAVLDNTLRNMFYRYGDFPEPQLEGLGITLLAKSTENQPAWDPVSIYLLSTDRPFFVTYDPSNTETPLEIHYPILSLPQGKISWSEMNIPEEPAPIYLYAYPSYSYGYCPDVSMSVGYATIISSNNLLIDLYIECLETSEAFDLVAYIEDKFGSNPVSLMETYQEEYESRTRNWFTDDLVIESYENSLDISISDSTYGFNQAFIQSKNPVSLRPLLLHMRSLVDQDDPQGPSIHQHLTFLIGVTYMLEENPCEAAPWFLEVWQTDPPSLWNNLAAAHLKVPDENTPSPTCP